MRKYNLKETRKIFSENAILINDNDVITEHCLVDLLGTEIASMKYEPGKEYNLYGTENGKYIKYFYYPGFKKAVTYHNVMQM